MLKEGKSIDDLPDAPKKPPVVGGPGSQWRMMKLRRVYEMAEEEGRSVEEVALERFGSLELFEEAREERRILDEREGKRASRDSDRDRGRDRKGKGRESEGPVGERRLIFTDLSTPSGGTSRSSSFRRPDLDRSGPPTPAGTRGMEPSKLGPGAGSVRAQGKTSIPSAMTPTSLTTPASGGKKRAMSPSELNKLQARVLRAKLIGAPDAETLEKEYEEAQRQANGGDAGEESVPTQVAVLPTLDIHGRLYDVGQGGHDTPPPPGNRKPKSKVSNWRNV